MPVSTIPRTDRAIHTHDLAHPKLALNLSARPWYLVDGQASMLMGVDIREPGCLCPDKGRKSAGVSLPTAEQPVSTVFAHGLSAYSSKRESWTVRECTIIDATASVATYTAATKTINKAGVFVHTHHVGDYFVATYNSTLPNTDADPREHAPIASRTDNNNIVLASALSTNGAATASVEGYIVRGRGFILASSTTATSSVVGYIKSPEEYAITGAFDESLKQQWLVRNGDARAANTEVLIIDDVVSTYQKNDTLVVPLTGSVPVDGDKFYVIGSRAYDKDGIWVTNGRKFWMLQDGAYEQYMDLGSDDYLGTRWSMAQISSHLFMFASAKYPSRILPLNAQPTTAVAGTEAYAGLPPPAYRSSKAGEFQYRGWLMTANGSGGSMSAGTIKAKVRAVNLDDGGESEFVDVADIGTPTSDELTVITDDKVTVHTPETAGTPDAPYWRPPDYPRYTHIELWRTQAGAPTGEYHLEARIEVTKTRPYGNEDPEGDESGLARSTVSASYWPFTLSDTDLTGQPVLLNADLSAGGLPPVCQKAVSLLGVTICAGKAADDAVPEHLGWAEQVIDWYSAAWSQSTKTLSPGGSIFTNYDPTDPGALGRSDLNSYVRVIFGGTLGMPIGQRSKVTAYTANTLTVEDDLGAGSEIGYTLEVPVPIEYPMIRDDELIWYSRTDIHAPESFPLRTLELSRTNDIFRNLVTVGNYAAVIMDSAVHLLYFVGTSLAKDTVASSSMGTPWPDSVVVLGSNVLWGTANGPKVMTVSNAADQRGHRGYIDDLDKDGAMHAWFREAYDKGYSIDSGVDVTNACIRWRRKQDDNTYQTAQFYWSDKRWVILDDDNGVGYAVSSRTTDTQLSSPALYSVTAEGAAFEVNHDGQTYVYEGATTQAGLDGTFKFGEVSIRKVGAFLAGMAGDIIQFRSGNGEVDGVRRVIRTATTDKLTFDAVPGLAAGDEFIIGGVHVKVRWAPLRGESQRSVKSLVAVTARIRPASSTANDTSYIALSARENFNEVPVAIESVELYDESDPTQQTQDATYPLEAQGLDIELQLESVGARSEYEVQKLLAEVTEERSAIDDASRES